MDPRFQFGFSLVSVWFQFGFQFGFSLVLVWISVWISVWFQFGFSLDFRLDFRSGSKIWAQQLEVVFAMGCVSAFSKNVLVPPCPILLPLYANTDSNDCMEDIYKLMASKAKFQCLQLLIVTEHLTHRDLSANGITFLSRGVFSTMTKLAKL